MELNLNVGQGLTYDVWYMSRQYDYPIPNSGLNTVSSTTTSILNIITNQSGRLGLTYPQRGGYDWTLINPQPKRKTFFEFVKHFGLI